MAMLGLSDATTRSYSSLIALVALTWEIIATFDDEYKYIWKRKWTPVKCIYLYCRYFSLVVQIVNYAITRGPISRVPVAHTICRTWFAFQIISTESLLYAFNALLMLRVYALYDRSRKIATFLAVIFVLDVTSTTIQTPACLRACSFDHTCLAMSTPPTTLSFCIQILVMQGMLWGMTLWKTGTVGWTGNSLVGLLVRDGAFVFVGTFVILVTAVPYSFFVKSLGHIIFSWFISLFSFAACRVTINLLRFDVTRAGTRDDVELTSCIDVPAIDQCTTTDTGAM